MPIECRVEYSTETDTQVISQGFEQIRKGSYQRKGILLFEEIHHECTNPYAILPLTITSKSLNYLKLSENQLQKFQDDWSSIQPSILDTLNKILVNFPFKEILLHPTSYGVRGWQISDNETVHIWHRIDFEVNFIVATILEAAIFKIYESKESIDEYYEGKPYQYKNAVLEFLLTSTPFSRIIPNYRTLANQTNEPEIDLALLKISDENYKKIGCPSKPALVIKNDKLFLNGETLDSITENQKKVLHHLLINSPNIVTFDDLAKIIWPKNTVAKFSINAITKTIHDLREFLQQSGLQKEIIFTKRKHGYLIAQ